MLPIESAFLFIVIMWFWIVASAVRLMKWSDNGY